ncbi:MAG: hypothetical protein IPQ18_04685 [Saprospiraceae bacterium]|nr:hypothetical protein [Saprospiraceae bacterium]
MLNSMHVKKLRVFNELIFSFCFIIFLLGSFFSCGDKVFNINKSDDPCSNKKQVNISIFHTPYKDTIKLGDTLKVKIESFFSEFNNPLIRLDTDSLDVPVELFISRIDTSNFIWSYDKYFNFHKVHGDFVFNKLFDIGQEEPGYLLLNFDKQNNLFINELHLVPIRKGTFVIGVFSSSEFKKIDPNANCLQTFVYKTQANIAKDNHYYLNQSSLDSNIRKTTEKDFRSEGMYCWVVK